MSLEIAKSVTKNTAVMMGSQVITWVSSFILMLFLPRYLGTVEYGRLYLATSIIGMGLIFIDFGGRYSISKEVSRFRDQIPSIIANSIGIRVALWAIATCAVIAFSYIAGYPSIVRILICIFSIEMLWEGIRKVLWSCFQGFENMKYPSLGAIVERVFITGIGVGALLLGAKSIIMAVIMTFGTFLNFMVCVKFTPQMISSLPKFNWDGAMKLLKEGVPYFLWSIFGIIYYRVDAVMLSLMTPETVVGWYGAAYRFFDILMFLPSIFSIAVFPVMSRLWKEENMLALTTRKSLEFILIAGIPVSVGIYAFSRQIIQLFFGLNEYGPSVLTLQIFSVGLLLVYVDVVLGTAILASDKQRQWSMVALVAVFMNISLNYFAIPYSQIHFGNGGIGSAVATIVTEFFVMTAAVFLIPKRIFEGSRIAVPLKGLTAGFLMAASIWLLRTGQITWIVQAIVSPMVYIVSLLSLKTLEPAELKFVRSSLTLQNLRRTFMPDKGATL
jgi:O-antigen/teichoic acid export membrane protein